MKKLESIFLREGKEFNETPTSKWFTSIRSRGVKMDNAKLEKLLKMAAKDEEPDTDNLEGDDKKNVDKAWKLLTTDLQAHYNHEEDLKEALAKQEKEETKRGEALIKASMEGHALSKNYEEQTVEVISSMLGKNFDVRSNGASIKKGVQLTEAEAARAVATMAEITERNDTVRSTSMLVLGGIVIGIKAQFGEDAGNQIIQQAVSITGKSKHTVSDSERVVLWTRDIFKDEVPVGLSYSHLAELKNHSQSKGGEPTIPAAEVRKIAKKVQEGKVVSPKMTKANGKEVEQRKVLSCAETRALLKEARGDKPTPPSKNGKYFYVNRETGEVFKTTGLNKDAAKSGEYVVIDAKGDNVMGAKGTVCAAIGELKVTEEPKAEVKKEEKPKGKAKKEVEDDTSHLIPD